MHLASPDCPAQSHGERLPAAQPVHRDVNGGRHKQMRKRRKGTWITFRDNSAVHASLTPCAQRREAQRSTTQHTHSAPHTRSALQRRGSLKVTSRPSLPCGSSVCGVVICPAFALLCLLQSGNFTVLATGRPVLCGDASQWLPPCGVCTPKISIWRCLATLWQSSSLGRFAAFVTALAAGLIPGDGRTCQLLDEPRRYEVG